jgi:hypothetical protein
MHDRIHVDDFDLPNAPHDRDIREKPAITGFDVSYGKVERLAPLNTGQHDKDILNPAIFRDREFLEEPEPASIRNPATIDRIGERDQIKPARHRFASLQSHLS